ncbi:MAG: DNA mismatch repair endonuclease MutL [Acholeplasmataceae bacterium]|nr:DNA mismatch repair endonuclease MutL [Acholeplasmataceae bacterium]
MPKIKQMEARLADMIAAGEVVDRPASVVKELVENAFDADATIIDVEIENVGMTSIRVTDNGTGMDPEDARMACLRHATSKISRDIDLSHIHTLGFRGEALAAIASVSRVILKTRLKGQEGYEVIIDGGHLAFEGAAALNPGTDIVVKNLFFNTPARFKHIKSEQSERLQIIDVFDRMAMSRPFVRMTLSIDQTVIRRTLGNHDMTALIDQIYGKNASRGITIIDTDVNKVGIKAYLLSPEQNRARNKDITVFINGRHINNYVLTQAVRDGYHGHLMVNRYPIAIIYLSIDPSLVDVNVHPQKRQVRLVNEAVVGYHLETHIRDALSDQRHHILRPLEQQEDLETIKVQSLFIEESDSSEDKCEDAPAQLKIPEVDYVGTYAGTYLLFQNNDGLYLIDQHAAQERIRYEYYYDALADPLFATKPLLIPYEPTLKPSDIETLIHARGTLLSYGFELTEEGLISAIPTWLKDTEIDKSLESMADMLENKHTIDLRVLRDHLAKDISCKGAIKANHPLSRQEINQLMRDLRTCKNPYRCPHGRPTIILLSLYDIEKMFKRVV